VISFECQCGAKVKVDDQLAGRMGRCPRCRRMVRIPGSAISAQPPALGVQQQAGGQAVEKSPLEEALAAASSQGYPMRQLHNGTAPSDDPFGLLAMQAASQPPRLPTQPACPIHHGLQRPRTSLEKNAPFMTAGFLILSTIFIPWFIGAAPPFFEGSSASRVTTFMSWDVIKFGPGMLTAFLITAWYIGLASVVAGFCLSDLPHAICTAGHGFAGVLFLSCLWLSWVGTPYVPFNSQGGGLVVVNLLGMIFLLLLLPALAIRRQLGRTTVIRPVQGIFSGALSILLVVGFILLIALFTDLPQVVRSQLVLDLVIGTLSQMLLLAGAVISLVDAARPKSDSHLLAEVATWILYGSLGLSGVYIVIRPATLGEAGGGIALFILNSVVLIIAPLLLLFLGGAARVIIEAVSAYRRKHPSSRIRQEAPTEEAVVPEELQQLSSAKRRLQQIQALYDDGLITKDEFTARRAAIVESV